MSFPIHFWEQVILPSLLSKSAMLVAAGMGVSNFAVWELLTDRTPLAILVSALSVMATAYFSSRPKVIAALAAREATRHVNAENTKDALIAQLRESERSLTAKMELVRVSKHNALDKLDEAQWHIFAQQGECRSNGHEPLPYTRVRIKEIFEHEDKELRRQIEEFEAEGDAR